MATRQKPAPEPVEEVQEGPVEAVAVTGRPQDVPSPNTTFAERAKGQKAVQAAENKAVGKADTK